MLMHSFACCHYYVFFCRLLIIFIISITIKHVAASLYTVMRECNHCLPPSVMSPVTADTSICMLPLERLRQLIFNRQHHAVVARAQVLCCDARCRAANHRTNVLTRNVTRYKRTLAQGMPASVAWDSGEVSSPDPVAYAAGLAPDTAYSATVMWWDDADGVSVMTLVG
jgi:hypothetical protein